MPDAGRTIVPTMSDDRRARSAAQADLAMSHRLTLVVAAPGWGKSTLLRRLGEQAPSVEVSRPPSGWTPFAVARGMLDGLRSLGLEPADDVLPPRPAPDSPDHPDHTTALAAACARLSHAIETPALVLLDDVETSAGDPLEQFLEALVLHLPLDAAPRRGLPASSGDAPRPTPGGRRDRCGSPARDLAITPTRSRARSRPGRRGDGRRDRRASRGGWPLAVQLAAGGGPPGGPVHHDELIERVLAPDAVLVEYLAEEVLAELTDGERGLLALAAHVPYLSDELLRRSRARPTSSAMLEALGRARMFLEPLARPPAYRASLLGGEFLRRALPPPAAPSCAGPSRRYRARGDVEAALVLARRRSATRQLAAAVVAARRPDRTGSPRPLDASPRRRRAPPADDPAWPSGEATSHYLRGDWDAALARRTTRAAELGDPGRRGWPASAA